MKATAVSIIIKVASLFVISIISLMFNWSRESWAELLTGTEWFLWYIIRPALYWSIFCIPVAVEIVISRWRYQIGWDAILKTQAISTGVAAVLILMRPIFALAIFMVFYFVAFIVTG